MKLMHSLFVRSQFLSQLGFPPIPCYPSQSFLASCSINKDHHPRKVHESDNSLPPGEAADFFVVIGCQVFVSFRTKIIFHFYQVKVLAVAIDGLRLCLFSDVLETKLSSISSSKDGTLLQHCMFCIIYTVILLEQRI